ncbi:hydroxyacylglutathione hydrolase [Candidatus Berkiella cookevillensis]|uniref:Hydroxyacylglutathione hydrolase n=1 Tax=Candidatus Berkiella cookevillensis TaxID=437022 RepID=A0A0Q9YVS7_9GAMM|nr:hydroxyacylglutathione hydrolase [Candidatus Berkiella cookevillensis]MCS5708223.1 hydroxyacylglutathione hydrolase [Candidatus Berkiella cookevillensis]
MNKIVPIPAFADNYIWAIHSLNDSQVAVVDPGDAEPVLQYLQKSQLSLNAILITHRHWDHTNGITQLLEHFPNVPVYGPNRSVYQITNIIEDGMFVTLEAQELKLSVMAIPGHTLDHIAYAGEGILFCGDTLFSAGCGRIFEGTPQQMYDSLNKLASLDDDTLIYCGHEYTLNNLAFALSLEPDNKLLRTKALEIAALRVANKASLPSRLRDEKTFNPFLKCHLLEFQNQITLLTGKELSSPVDFFTEVRSMKDHFKA